MGKRNARNRFTRNAKTKVHVNDPVRPKTVKHSTVKKRTETVLNEKAAALAAGIGSRPTGPRSGDVIPTRTGGIPKSVDEFGNPLSPDNDAFFDGGADIT